MLFGSNRRLPVHLPRGALQTNASPPRILLTTNTSENQTWMWNRLVCEGASSAPDKWLGTKVRNYVSVFQTKLTQELSMFWTIKTR